MLLQVRAVIPRRNDHCTHHLHTPAHHLHTHLQVRAVIPRRNDLPGDRGVLIISYASHKKKAYSFFLVQVGACKGNQIWMGLNKEREGAVCACVHVRMCACVCACVCMCVCV